MPQRNDLEQIRRQLGPRIDAHRGHRDEPVELARRRDCSRDRTRHPLKKLEANEEALLQLLRPWQGEAAGAGRTIARVAVAFEAGRDGFWLARS